MPTTPSPPRRIHTPPPPLHGTRYDSWTPYSPPRRSSRVAAQRNKSSSEQDEHPLASSKKRPAVRSARASTPVASSKRTATRTSAHTLSPPSSPSSPDKRSRTKKTAHRTLSLDHDADSGADSDPFVTSAKGESFSTAAAAVLPTPSKTPAKPKALPKSAFTSAARVLFSDRPATIDEAMPSPRRSRKGRKHAGFSLTSFADDCDDDGHSKIEIYTDSKERVPSYDDSEDNPFVSKSDDNARTEPGPKRRKTKTHEDELMERRVRNNEGFISVFRGKKIFTEFTNNSDESASEPDSPLGGSPVRRAAGAVARRRVTRSSIKPRLLWPNDEQQRARETAQAAEEDTTDIEAPALIASSSKRFRFSVSDGRRSVPADSGPIDLDPPAPSPAVNANVITRSTATTSTSTTAVNASVITRSAATTSTSTPAKQRFFEPTTPPPSRNTRASAKKEAHLDVPPPPVLADSSPSRTREVAPEPSREPLAVPKKRSPFDSWRRTKAGTRTVSTPAKREGEPLEAGGSKRTRSAAHPSNAG